MNKNLVDLAKIIGFFIFSSCVLFTHHSVWCIILMAIIIF